MNIVSKNKTIAAAILAGGNASRLGGVAKGTLNVGKGIYIVDRLIKELYESGISKVIIITNDSIPYLNCGVKIISDIRSGIGPLGGIEAALVYFENKFDAVMFVPCDMPNITAKELLALKQAFFETNNYVVFAETESFFWHPLCAVVHIGLKEYISFAVDHGQLKIRDLWKQFNAKTVQFLESNAFLNINDFEDLKKWQKVCT